MAETVLVLGASPKPERYSFKAVQMLTEYGHKVLPVNPYHPTVSGVACLASIADARLVWRHAALSLTPVPSQMRWLSAWKAREFK